AADPEHPPRVLRQGLLLPRVLDGAEHRHQRGRRRQVHPPRQRVLEQPLVVLEGGGEEGLAGHEHDHELGRLRQGRPVRLRAELVHVGTQVPGEGGDARFALAAAASRYAASDTLESTTMFLPPASRTTMSGRCCPPASITCSSKSTWDA